MLRAKSRESSVRRSQQGEQSETTRKAALKWLAVFILVMVVLTLANRALTELSVAAVTIVSPQRGSLNREVSADGTLTAGDEIGIFLSTVYRVADIYVKIGDEVAVGDPLFMFDLAQLNQQLEDAQIALQKQENSRESSLITTNNSAPDTTVADALLRYERQQEDYRSTVETQERKVNDARVAVDDAVAARDKAQREYDDAVQNAYSDAVKSAQDALNTASQKLSNANNSYNLAEMQYQQSMNKAESDRNNPATGTDPQLAYNIAVTQAQNALETSRQSLQTAQNDYYKAQQNLYNIDVTNTVASKKTALENAENNITSKQTALENALRDQTSALNTAQRSLDDTETSYAKAKATAAASSANSKGNEQKSALSLENTDLDLQVKRDEVAAMQKLVDDGGIIYADESGSVTAINLTRFATPQSSSPLIKLADVSTGLKLSVQVSTANAEYMAVGDEVTITLADGGFARSTIYSISSVADNSNVKEVVVYLQSSAGIVGDKVRLRFSKRSESYDTLVPLGALRQDSDGYFVYSIRQSEDTLGARTTIERVDVSLLDSDSSRAAVSGAISRNDSLVERSDRTLSDGDRVRAGE